MKYILFAAAVVAASSGFAADAPMYPGAFSFTVRDPVPESVVNYSYMNHKPAGKFGRLRNINGDFVFENGEKVRFFGLNVVADRIFNMTHEEADTVAAKIAALGFNMVRLHHLTPVWQKAVPFYTDRNRSTLEFNDEALERLDYFCAALKKQGVYLTDEIVDSSMSPAPCELPDGKSVGFALYKILLMTEPAVQEHAKEFIRRFYLRRNRYTGLSLFEDPQFALLGLVNEISIGYHNRILSRFMREPYYTTIDNDFQGYLRERKIAAKRFDPEFNDRDSAEYWNWKLRRSYAMWSAFVRELGYKGPICGSNYAENIFHVEPSLGGDYLDAHMYWGYADWLKGKLRPVGENMWSILLQEPFNSGYYTKQTFARFSQASVPGYPLICSENRTSSGGGVQWGKGTPDLYSAYRAVGIPFLATVQAFQEWDGFYTFASQGPERLGDPPRMNHTLDLRFDTVCLGTTPFSAYLLRGNVIRPARRKVLLRYSGNELFGSGRFNPTFFSDVLFQMPERHKTEVSYPGMNVPEAGYDRVFEYGRNDALPEVRRNPVVEADTGEFYRNWREGFFVVKAPAVQGAEGFFLKTKRFELPDFVLTVKSDFGIFFIAAREGIPLSRAPRMMFFAGGECANTHKPGEQKALYGWSYSGTAPVQLKPVAGTLEAGSGRFDVWSLGERGERLAKVAENVGAFEFDTGRDRTIWYELERRQGR